MPGDRRAGPGWVARSPEDGHATDLISDWKPSERLCRGRSAHSSGGLIPLGDPLDEFAKIIDGAWVVVVQTSGGRYRRRCFMTVAAAERAARNALAAGHETEILLAQLRPLRKLKAGGS